MGIWGFERKENLEGEFGGRIWLSKWKIERNGNLGWGFGGGFGGGILRLWKGFLDICLVFRWDDLEGSIEERYLRI